VFLFEIGVKFMVIELDEETILQVKKMFKNLEKKVIIKFFEDPDSECTYCDDIEELYRIISDLSDKVELKKYNKDSEEAKKYNVEIFPATLIHSESEEYNIRFFGFPAGYEFGALIEDIIDVSQGKTRLHPLLRKILKEEIDRKVRILVFVTPTCPYCPLAVRSAHKFALENPNIVGDMIESIEFQQLASKYNVYTVPKIIIQVNGEDKEEFEGAAPDAYLILKILEAMDKDIPKDLELLVNQGYEETHKS